MIKFFPDKEVGGIKGWNWLEYDTGAWEGPKKDWETAHYPNIQKYANKFRTVIQAGGNQGMYPRLLSHMFERVYTFEPDHLNFAALVSNCHHDNIIKIQAALGEQNTFCDMYRPCMSNTGMHEAKIDLNSTIPMINLDSFLTRSDVDLVMLDLEGYELPALKGMVRIIELNHPVIFVERANQAVKDFLANFGYKLITTSAMDMIFIV